MPLTSKVTALRNFQDFVTAIGPENARCIRNLCLELPEIAPLYYLRTITTSDPAQQETPPLVVLRSFLIETQAIFVGQPAIILSRRTVAMMVLNPDGKAVNSLFLTTFPFSSCSGGRRPFPPSETGLLTLELSKKGNADFEIIQVHLWGLSLLWEEKDWQQSSGSIHPFLTGVSALKPVPGRRLRWRSRRESKSGMKSMFYHF